MSKITPKQRFEQHTSKVEMISILFTAAKRPENEHLMHADYFNVHNLFTVTDLFNARVHYGHREGTLDDRMKPYIFGKRMSHIIFDLDKTALYLRKALNFAAHTAYRDGLILFVGRSPQCTNLIESTAKECGEFAHARRWRGGLFTNSVMQFREVTRLPDLCIFLTTLNDVLMPHPGIKESAKMMIPTIGIVDSNCNPSLITYPVPGNDDSAPSIEFYCNVFKQAILRGKQKAKEDAAIKRKQQSIASNEVAAENVQKVAVQSSQ